MLCFLLSLLFCGVLCTQQWECTAEELGHVKIASWNIRILSNTRTDAELHMIGQVIQKFDFVAIMELRDSLVLDRLVQIMQKDFGKTYKYELSPKVGSATQKELYAFLYAYPAFSVVKSGKLFEQISFFRQPFYATFRVGNFDFTPIVIHVVWGTSVPERRKEINNLAQVYRSIQDEDPRENDVILVGDFNRNPDDDLAWGPLHTLPSMVHLFNLPEKSMILDTNLYDNMLFQSQYVRECTLDRGIVRFDETDFGNNDEAASEAVSDHRPIWALYQVNGVDDD